MAKIELGLVVTLRDGADHALQKVHALGIPTCQLCCWQPEVYTPENVRAINAATRKTGVRISALWGGYPGPRVWNFTRGPSTIGLPPEQWREARVQALKKGADFARALGVTHVATHAGFIPENPADPRYKATVTALRRIARYYRHRGIEFWFETGQETPVTLLRTIQDIATDNLGINLDPANLIMYGKANPVDALDVFGQYVKGFHAKDGLYPTDGRSLGKETPLGKGKVNFPLLLKTLYRLGFRGPLTIEREISGPRQIRDIKKGKEFLENIIRRL